MEVSKNNFWLKLYRYSMDDGEDPRDLCSLFWGGLVGLADVIIFFPATIWNFVLAKDTDDGGVVVHFFKTLFVIGIYIIAIFIGIIAFALFGLKQVDAVWTLTVAPVIGLVVSYLIIQIGYKISDAYVNYRRRKGVKERRPSVIVEGFKAIKNKACPIIEYVED